MMVPDYALISEIRLYSFGFGEPRPLAQKLVRVLQLCSEQLSSQKHYDYGMRAVNSILVACGSMRQKVGDDPTWDEKKIVLRSVYDVNLPKFTSDDLPLFRGITSDLFPGVDLPVADHGPLLETIDDQCREGITQGPGRVFKCEPVPSFTTKIRELYEMVGGGGWGGVLLQLVAACVWRARVARVACVCGSRLSGCSSFSPPLRHPVRAPPRTDPTPPSSHPTP